MELCVIFMQKSFHLKKNFEFEGHWIFGWITLWPEWPFGQRQFGRRDSLASVTFASDTLARVTLWPETLWPEWHFGQFFLLPLGYQRVNKNSIGGTIGKNLKKNNLHFSFFFPPFGTPKEARKSGQSFPLAKVPVAVAKVSPAKVTLAKLSLRPKCFWPKCHSGQSVIQPILHVHFTAYYLFRKLGMKMHS